MVLIFFWHFCIITGHFLREILFLHLKGVSSEDSTVLKLGGYAFAGKYENAIGSVVIFEDVSEDNADSKLKYLGHTTKVLKANRIFLKEKVKKQAAAN